MESTDADANPADDLHCPVCDYALRGLPEPRCPECGYAFEWAELRERQRLKQGWFYEHAGTMRSHVRTRWRSLRPWSFWTQVHAYTDADPRRLSRYQWTTVALVLLVACLIMAAVVGEDALRHAAMSAARRPTVTFSFTIPSGRPQQLSPNFLKRIPARMRPPGWTSASTQPVYVVVTQPTAPPWVVQWATRSLTLRDDRFSAGKVGMVVLATLGVPLLLPAYWVLLRRSVLKAAVRPVHLSRVQAYTVDALPLLLASAVLADLAWTVVFPDVGWRKSLLTLLTPSLVPGTIVVGGLTIRLAFALRRYLRFPHATGVALAFGVIALLAWLAVVMPVRTEF